MQNQFVEKLRRQWNWRHLPKLDILLANDALVGPGGTEFWTLEMAKALTELGHSVVVYSPKLGYFAWQFISPISILTNEMPRRKFDLLLINHQTCFNTLKHVRGVKIYTSHSWFLDIERCPQGADGYVAVSEHIQSIEHQRGFECHVINNPFDTQKYTSTKPVNASLSTVFARVTSQSQKAKYLRKVLKKVKAELITLDEVTYDLQEKFNQADLVLAIGRELVEAMLCERNVISMDLRGLIPHYGGAGFIDNNNYTKLKPFWFSGREHPIPLDQEAKLVRELRKYNPEVGPQLRKNAIRDFNSKQIALKYLYLYVAYQRSISGSIHQPST